jgi:ABC-2 type transport system ATP-binding protein
MTDETMIEIEGLTRRFATTTAVDGLNLQVRRGELFGLVGPDGAGKTTTLRLLTGVLRADSGTIRVGGLPIPAALDQVRRRLGYVAQRFSLYGDLTVAENLSLTASLFGVPRAIAAERAGRLLHLTGLTAARDRQAQFLSGGMKQKLALAAALIHEPDLLVLDEPTNGVDPVARREFWRLLTGLRGGGVTVIVSTAYLDEAELCGRIGFMAGGRLLAIGAPAELRALADEALIEVTARPRGAALTAARAVAGVTDVRAMGSRLQVAFPANTPLPAASAALTAALTTAGVTFEDVRPATPTLEDAVIRLTRRGLSDERRGAGG